MNNGNNAEHKPVSISKENLISDKEMRKNITCKLNWCIMFSALSLILIMLYLGTLSCLNTNRYKTEKPLMDEVKSGTLQKGRVSSVTLVGDSTELVINQGEKSIRGIVKESRDSKYIAEDISEGIRVNEKVYFKFENGEIFLVKGVSKSK